MRFFRKPFKLFAIDADTGKPLDPNVRRRTYVKYYDIKPSSSGSKSLVAHKAPSDQEKKVEITTEDVKKDKNGKGKGQNGGEGGRKNESGGKQQQQKGADEAWTAEEDEKLKAMKAEGKTWAEITAEIGRPRGHCQSRFKEISAAAGGNDDKKNERSEGGGKKGKGGGGGGGGGEQNQNQNAGNNNQGEGKKGKKNKGGNENNPKAQNQQSKNAEAKANKKTKPASNHGGKASSETLFTMHDWQTLQEDDLFSFGELQCLSELIAKDSEQSWERIAARFFDLTGRRVHWEDVRDKFEGMAWAAYKASK